MNRLAYVTLVTALAACLAGLAHAQDPVSKTASPAKAVLTVIPVWPGVAPGSEDWTRKEVRYRNDWDHRRMVRNVTTPALTYGGGTNGVRVPEDAPPLFILRASEDTLSTGSVRLYSE